MKLITVNLNTENELVTIIIVFELQLCQNQFYIK